MSTAALRRIGLGALVAACSLWGPEAPGIAAPATHGGAPEGAAGTAEARGRAIFARGVSPSGGALDAVIGGGATVVPASTLPCAGCHGPEGRGRPEGGVTPSDLRWAQLTRPYEVESPSGRAHGAYDDRRLGRAVTMGVDPAGNRLGDAMPRYRLSAADLRDLVAYVKTLGTEADPGVGEATLRIGALVPPGARAAVGALFDEVNGRGGLYDRRVELRCADLPDGATPEQEAEAARDLVDRERPFAVIGGASGAAALLEARRTPLVGVAGRPPAGPVPRYVFYLGASSASPAARALAGAQLLVEGLKRAGRDLRREGLVEALEGVHDFGTGLVPPLGYGRNRREGARGDARPE